MPQKKKNQVTVFVLRSSMSSTERTAKSALVHMVAKCSDLEFTSILARNVFQKKFKQMCGSGGTS